VSYSIIYSTDSFKTLIHLAMKLVFVSELLNHLLNQFIQNTDPSRKEMSHLKRAMSLLK